MGKGGFVLKKKHHISVVAVVLTNKNSYTTLANSKY